MSAHQVIGYTPEIGKALKRILAETPQTDTGKLAYKKGKKQQLLQGRKKTLAGNFEYNGYFKIIDASEYDEEGNVTAYKISVVNGKTGGSSIFIGDETHYYVEPYTSEPFTESGHYTVYLRYTVYEGGSIYLYKEKTSLPYPGNGKYYVLGEVVFTPSSGEEKGDLKIVQSHGTVIQEDTPENGVITLSVLPPINEYTGAFAIRTVTNGGSLTVYVVNGSTWNGTSSGGGMPCTVNNLTVYLNDASTGMPKDSNKLYAYIHFKGNLTSSTGSVDIEFSDTYPQEATLTDAYYPIGMVSAFSNGVVQISQTHRSGNIQMYWWSTCNSSKVG